MTTTITRREAILRGLFGAGYVGLRALATGLPVSAFLHPRSSLADACQNQGKGQYLILSTASTGDPLNANVAGMYDDERISHSPNPLMAKTDLTQNGVATSAARAWAGLPQAVLDRTVFFHHTTLTNSHASQSKVMKLMGAIKRQEMLVSLIAKEMAPCLGTVQREPLVVGASGPGEYLSFGGRTLPPLPPTALRDVLVRPAGVLGQLQDMRARDLDKLNALYKEHGSADQRLFLDRLARSQAEVRSISDALINSLATITSNGVDGQIAAALALIQMNVAPVVSIRLPWGGDNHNDVGLNNEALQTAASVTAIGSLQARLQAAGLADRVSFWATNVFGRTLNADLRGTTGRDHNGSHHAAVFIGKGFRGGVVGGVELRGRDFAARSIDSQSGRAVTGGDIPYAETFGAVGKTLAHGVGLAPTVYNDLITLGKSVQSALV